MKGFILGIAILFSIMVVGQVAAAEPPPPTGVNATDGLYPDRVTVTWNQVADYGIYRVHRCSTISGDCTPISYQTGSSFNDTNGKNNTIFDYRVQACEHLGDCSSLSEADQGYRGFVVSAGQSGSWYDPSRNGEGFFLQVLSSTQVVGYWFTYDTEGNQLWMTGVGNIEGANIYFPELVSPFGGKFGPDFDPDDVSYPPWGSLEFKFSDCHNASVKYSGPKTFGNGKLDVSRLTSLWGLGCKGEQFPNVSTGRGFLSSGISGSWYDIAHSGEGFAVEILNEVTADVMWFTYDTQGNPVWIAGLGEIVGGSIFFNDLQITSGAVFGDGFNPDDVNSEHWGEASYNFTSCGEDGDAAGSMQYIPPPEFGEEGSQSLYRSTSISGLECELLSYVYNVSGSMDVAENTFIDGDVNDPNVPEIPNDSDAQPQLLAAPAELVGFATALPTDVDGDRFAAESDEWDFYQLPLQNGETVILNVSDWNLDDPLANDLDLYLLKLDEPDVVIDSSENATELEWVSAPEAGTYLVGVHALAGTSNYLLKSGQSVPIGLSKFSSSAAIAEGELIAAMRLENNLTSVSDQSSDRIRIEKIEKDNALTRLKESFDGEVLYTVDTSRVDHLVPHPLTMKGLGTTSVENWQVIRAAKELSVSDHYRWSGPNYLLQGLIAPDDPGYDFQWHYSLIDLPQAWNITTGSEDVVVAVIDSGVHDHPDLVSNVDYSLGYDFVASPLSSGDGDGLDPDARDPGEMFPAFGYFSHGTHVAGTVGAASNNGTGVAGVNWDVTIMPVRVLGIENSGNCWEIAQGMKWAGGLTNDTAGVPARVADVINMSLGSDLICDGQQELVDRLTSKGIIIIAAAGNDASSIPLYPAALDGVISVSATTINDELAYYSSYGESVDVAAPGGDMTADSDGNGDPDGVLSTVMVIEQGSSVQTNAYEYSQGTSMASPHIAGVAAIMKSVYPEMGSDEFFTAISSGEITIDLANDGSTTKDPSFGYGRIDAKKATDWALEQGSQPIPPYLTSSISSADFGSSQLSISFELKKGGSGDISVAGSEVSDTWLQLFSAEIDDDGLGTYHIEVDRAGLVNGEYSGWTAINASDGSGLLIPVAMQVGEKVAGEAGYQYAVLIDSFTLEEVANWEGLATDEQYPITFNDVPFGLYILVVGSDIDNDFEFCDKGEFCQAYPLNSSPGLIDVYDQDVDLGLFTLRSPEDEGIGEVLLSDDEIGSQIDGSRISDLMRLIGTSGFSRTR
ncbi:MAG: S8 family serine peptidase [Xanthomonadales bacterium]|nr:S8 family serine peptidase [Xanthomonadales bacterium]